VQATESTCGEQRGGQLRQRPGTKLPLLQQQVIQFVVKRNGECRRVPLDFSRSRTFPAAVEVASHSVIYFLNFRHWPGPRGG